MDKPSRKRYRNAAASPEERVTKMAILRAIQATGYVRGFTISTLTEKLALQAGNRTVLRQNVQNAVHELEEAAMIKAVAEKFYVVSTSADHSGLINSTASASAGTSNTSVESNCSTTSRADAVAAAKRKKPSPSGQEKNNSPRSVNGALPGANGVDDNIDEATGNEQDEENTHANEKAGPSGFLQQMKEKFSL